MVSPAVIFGVFLVIFVATAIITLLGVVGSLKRQTGDMGGGGSKVWP